MPQLTEFFFSEPSIDRSLIETNKQLKKLSNDEIDQLLTAAYEKLATLEDWSAEAIQTTLNELLEQTGQKPGILFSLIRIALTWTSFSPQLDATIELLGKEKTLARIHAALNS